MAFNHFPPIQLAASNCLSRQSYQKRIPVQHRNCSTCASLLLTPLNLFLISHPNWQLQKSNPSFNLPFNSTRVTQPPTPLPPSNLCLPGLLTSFCSCWSRYSCRFVNALSHFRRSLSKSLSWEDETSCSQHASEQNNTGQRRSAGSGPSHSFTVLVMLTVW